MSHQARLRLVVLWAACIAACTVGALAVGAVGSGTAPSPIAWPATIGLGILTAVLTMLAMILLLRRPGHKVGLVFAGLASLTGLSNFADVYVKVSYAGDRAPLPGAVVAGWVGMWTPGVLWLLIALLLLLFPTGHLPSRRWRPVVWAAAVVYGSMMLSGMFGPGHSNDMGPVNPFALPVLAPLIAALGDAIWQGSMLVIVAAATSLFARYRSGGGTERKQLKWLTLSGILVVAGGTVMLVAAVAGARDQLSFIAGVLFGGGLASIPVFATLAILRYRLYDIDRLVSRTLSYAAVTGVLVAVYAAAVFSLSALVASLGGGSEVGVAGATLAVAAAFRPVRGRVQRVVDRRFNRAQYDAGRTVQGFSERLRDRVDVDEVGADLLQTTLAVVQPVRAVLWLRPER